MSNKRMDPHERFIQGVVRAGAKMDLRELIAEVREANTLTRKLRALLPRDVSGDGFVMKGPER
jgi:hypothetical protein